MEAGLVGAETRCMVALSRCVLMEKAEVGALKSRGAGWGLRIVAL